MQEMPRTFPPQKPTALKGKQRATHTKVTKARKKKGMNAFTIKEKKKTCEHVACINEMQ